MTQDQITQASIQMLTRRMDWLGERLNKIEPILKGHYGDGPKLKNPHHVNKIGKEVKLAYAEIAKIEDEMERRGKLPSPDALLSQVVQEKFGAEA